MGSRDRRKAPRHVPARDLARVGWWRGSDFQHVPARLCDLSSSGAALSLEETPGEADAVWICLAGAEATDWVRTNIAWIRTDESGERRIGLAFQSVCPLPLFRTAIWGTPAPGRSHADADSDEDGSQAGASPTELNLPPPPRVIAPDAGPPRAAAALPSCPSSASLPEEPAWTFVAVAGADSAPVLRPALGSGSAGIGIECAGPTSPLAWIVPALMKTSLALILALVAIETFSDLRILEPLVNCLTQE